MQIMAFIRFYLVSSIRPKTRAPARHRPFGGHDAKRTSVRRRPNTCSANMLSGKHLFGSESLRTSVRCALQHPSARRTCVPGKHPSVEHPFAPGAPKRTSVLPIIRPSNACSHPDANICPMRTYVLRPAAPEHPFRRSSARRSSARRTSVRPAAFAEAPGEGSSGKCPAAM